MTQNDLTVLVVGAGANADFRFKNKKKAEEEKIAMPTGEQLVEKIADWEGQVLPNLYWGFIAKIAAKYCNEESQIESITSLIADKESKHHHLLVSTTNIAQQITLRIKNDFKSWQFFDDLGLSGLSINHYQTNNNVTSKIRLDDKFSWYHKISEIVKHYQPFSIDEMLDSIKVGKIDVSKWTGKTENDEDEREKLIQAGKDLIALFLLQSEDKKVFDYDSICWYRHLRNAIITCGKNKKEIEEKLKNFVMISFNYDRSLDYFLRTRVGEFYDEIRVIYPYGLLAGDEKYVRDGRWDAETKDYKELLYGAAKGENSFQKKWENFQKAKGLAADLKVIGELEENDKGRKKIKEMQECIKIFGAAYFLGFSFHEENCRVLGMEEDAFKKRLSDLRGKSVNDIFYTNLYSSLKIKSGFDSIFNPPHTPFELGKTSQKGNGTYDALSQDFDFRLKKPTR